MPSFQFRCTGQMPSEPNRAAKTPRHCISICTQGHRAGCVVRGAEPGKEYGEDDWRGYLRSQNRRASYAWSTVTGSRG